MQRYRSKQNILTELNSRTIEVKKALDAVKSKDQSFTDWIYVGDVNAPAFQGTWAAFSDGSDGRPRPSFIRDSSGWVHLQGVLAGITIQTVAFTLPIGFRPGKPSNSATGIHFFPVFSNSAFGAVEVRSDGQVFPWVGTASAIHLTGISFRAEN